MKKSQLSDKQLEDILGQMPKVKDHRDPRDIYQNIAHRVEKRRMPAWVFPSVATAAVLMLAFILSSGFLDRNQSADYSFDSKSSSESTMDMDAGSEEKAVKESADQENSSLKMDLNDTSKTENFRAMDVENSYGSLTALYPEEVEAENHQAITYAIPDKTGQILVPITVTIPKAEENPWIETFTETMPMLKEDEWGLSDYYPIDATWTYDEASKTLNMDVKDDHIYRYGSVSNTMLLDAMSQNLAGKGIEKLTFSTEKQKGIDFGNHGVKDKGAISSAAIQNRAYLFFNVDGGSKPLLVPTTEQFKTIDSAFEQMRISIDVLNLKPSLPENFKFDNNASEKDKSVLRVLLNDNTLLNDGFLPNLEAILLTAKEFGYKGVKIENANIDQLGPFNLNEVLPLPLAPNKKNID